MARGEPMIKTPPKRVSPQSKDYERAGNYLQENWEQVSQLNPEAAESMAAMLAENPEIARDPEFQQGVVRFAQWAKTGYVAPSGPQETVLELVRRGVPESDAIARVGRYPRLEQDQLATPQGQTAWGEPKSVGTAVGEGISAAPKAALDLLSMAGRGVGAAVDATLNDNAEQGWGENYRQSLGNTGGFGAENAPPSGQDRSTLGNFVQAVVRDPLTVLPLGKVAEVPMLAGMAKDVGTLAQRAIPGGRKLATAAIRKGRTEALQSGRAAQSQAAAAESYAKAFDAAIAAGASKEVAAVEATRAARALESSGDAGKIVAASERAKSLSVPAEETYTGLSSGVLGGVRKLAPEAGNYAVQGAVGAGAEGTRQAMEGDDVSVAPIVAGGIAPFFLGGLGSAFKEAGRDLLRGRLKFTPRDQSARFSEDAGTLLDEGLVPVTGGANGTLARVQQRLQEVNRVRGGAMDATDKARTEALAELGSLSPASVGPRESVRDVIRANSADFAQLYDNALAKIVEKGRSGEFSPTETAKMVAELDRQYAELAAYANGEEGLGSALALQKRGNAWFDEGSVNASQSNAEKRAAQPQVARALWESSRPVMEAVPTLGEAYKATSAQYRKLLPLETALERKLPAVGNRSMLELGGPGSAGPLEPFRSNPSVRSIYGIGSSLSNPGWLPFSPGNIGRSVARQLPQAITLGDMGEQNQ